MILSLKRTNQYTIRSFFPFESRFWLNPTEPLLQQSQRSSSLETRRATSRPSSRSSRRDEFSSYNNIPGGLYSVGLHPGNNDPFVSSNLSLLSGLDSAMIQEAIRQSLLG
jgi:hypothetical protein